MHNCVNFPFKFIIFALFLFSLIEAKILFLLFINDVSDVIDIEHLTDSNLDLLSLFMLIFADDIALFTTSPESLQQQLNNINEYSKISSMKININKTKICIHYTGNMLFSVKNLIERANKAYHNILSLFER